MLEFDYKAARRNGTLQEGRITASNQEIAQRQLRAQGLTPISLQQAVGTFAKAGSSAKFSFMQRNKVGSTEVLAMTSELNVLLRAGLPLDRAFRLMIETNAHPGMSLVINDILESIKSGRGLSQALGKHRELFDEFYINMIRAGEASGQVSETLQRLSEHLERSRQLRESIVSALIYPIILLVVAVLSVALMLGFVVPQFESVFASMGKSLPLPTRIIIALGDGIANYGWLMILVIIALALLWRHWRATPTGTLWWHRRLLSLPVFGQLLVKYQITRFARTMGALLRGGVSMLESLDIAVDTFDNRHLNNAMQGVNPAVKGGSRMAPALKSTGIFSGVALQMVQIGDESGQLDEMFLNLANIYDNEVQAGIKRSLTLLEPVIIFLMGTLIAVIIISILMGIMSVNELAI
ncbi:MAG: type II secretion system F family protein [Thiohalomonadaceae bacterium]